MTSAEQTIQQDFNNVLINEYTTGFTPQISEADSTAEGFRQLFPAMATKATPLTQQPFNFSYNFEENRLPRPPLLWVKVCSASTNAIKFDKDFEKDGNPPKTDTHQFAVLCADSSESISTSMHSKSGFIGPVLTVPFVFADDGKLKSFRPPTPPKLAALPFLYQHTYHVAMEILFKVMEIVISSHRQGAI